MILPKKHTPLEASFFGFGAYLLTYIKKNDLCGRSVGPLQR